MTNDEVLNMPAGREMDIIILRDILKYKPKYIQEGSLFGVAGELNCWYDDEDGRFIPLGTSPSTDISVAWKVAEKMRIMVRPSPVSGWVAAVFQRFYFDGKWEGMFETQAETAPLAICRTSLLAFYSR